MDDRRRTRRTQMSLPVTFLAGDGESGAGRTVDVSPSGVQLRSKDVSPPGTGIRLVFFGGTFQRPMQVPAVVTRLTPGGMGLSFDKECWPEGDRHQFFVAIGTYVRTRSQPQQKASNH